MANTVKLIHSGSLNIDLELDLCNSPSHCKVASYYAFSLMHGIRLVRSLYFDRVKLYLSLFVFRTISKYLSFQTGHFMETISFTSLSFNQYHHCNLSISISDQFH